MSNYLHENGKIHLFIGPIFSGKSTRLRNSIQKLKNQNFKTILVNYYNKKYIKEESQLITHDLIREDSLSCDNLTDILNQLINYDVIGIDEGQFFSDLLEICDTLTRFGKIIFIAALSSDDHMKPYDNISKLIPFADKIKLMKAYCYFCHKQAGFNLKIKKCKTNFIDERKDNYQPVCKNCFYIHS